MLNNWTMRRNRVLYIQANLFADVSKRMQHVASAILMASKLVSAVSVVIFLSGVISRGFYLWFPQLLHKQRIIHSTISKIVGFHFLFISSSGQPLQHPFFAKATTASSPSTSTPSGPRSFWTPWNPPQIWAPCRPWGQCSTCHWSTPGNVDGDGWGWGMVPFWCLSIHKF